MIRPATRTVRCDLCGKIDEFPLDDEPEANEERERLFGSPRASDDAIVCDECFEKIRPDKHGMGAWE